MPSFIGSSKVVSNSGTINYGDNLITSPTTSSKTFNGAGSGVTGDLSSTHSIFSIVLTNNSSLADNTPRKSAYYLPK